MKSGLVYSLNCVLFNPGIFSPYVIVYDEQHTETRREEIDVSWLRRLFGASKTEYRKVTEPARTVIVYSGYMVAHPAYKKQIQQSIEEYRKGRL